jgi:aminoglycoside phosphotransferase family enzyme
LPRAAATPRALRDPERLKAGLLKLREQHRQMPMCIIHGDTHLNNLYVTADGEPGFFDWSPRRTAWSNDVAYFMPAALDVPDRRVHEQDLLRHYVGRLEAHGGPALDFDDAWLAYRRELVWGMFVFLINGPTQTEYSNTAAAARFAAAMLDHDTNGLLGV